MSGENGVKLTASQANLQGTDGVLPGQGVELPGIGVPIGLGDQSSSSIGPSSPVSGQGFTNPSRLNDRAADAAQAQASAPAASASSPSYEELKRQFEEMINSSNPKHQLVEIFFELTKGASPEYMERLGREYSDKKIIDEEFIKSFFSRISSCLENDQNSSPDLKKVTKRLIFFVKGHASDPEGSERLKDLYELIKSKACDNFGEKNIYNALAIGGENQDLGKMLSDIESNIIKTDLDNQMREIITAVDKHGKTWHNPIAALIAAVRAWKNGTTREIEYALEEFGEKYLAKNEKKNVFFHNVFEYVKSLVKRGTFNHDAVDIVKYSLQLCKNYFVSDDNHTGDADYFFDRTYGLMEAYKGSLERKTPLSDEKLKIISSVGEVLSLIGRIEAKIPKWKSPGFIDYDPEPTREDGRNEFRFNEPENFWLSNEEHATTPSAELLKIQRELLEKI